MQYYLALKDNLTPDSLQINYSTLYQIFKKLLKIWKKISLTIKRNKLMYHTNSNKLLKIDFRIFILFLLIFTGCQKDITGTYNAFTFILDFSIKSYNQDQATLFIKTDQEAEVYIILQEAGQIAPSKDQILAGMQPSGKEALKRERIKTKANQVMTLEVMNFPKYKSFDFYMLAIHSSGNFQIRNLQLKNRTETVIEGLKNLPEVFSFVVSEKGTTVIEKYFNGFSDSTLADSRSMQKGILSILTGIAIEKGLLKLNSTLGQYIPLKYNHLLDEQKRSITVEHFLTMTSGLGGLESEFNQWVQKPDEIVDVLERPMRAKPGVLFDYSTPNLHLLTVLFQEATKMTVHDFAKKYLFEPLGILKSEWILFETGYSGPLIYLQTKDYLKIGEMVMNRGIFQIKKMINTDYVDQMLMKRNTPNGVYATSGLTGDRFGYLWWGLDRKDIKGFATIGYGGQYIWVIPEKEVVVAINSKTRNVLAVQAVHLTNLQKIMSDFVDSLN